MKAAVFTFQWIGAILDVKHPIAYLSFDKIHDSPKKDAPRWFLAIKRTPLEKCIFLTEIVDVNYNYTLCVFCVIYSHILFNQLYYIVYQLGCDDYCFYIYYTSDIGRYYPSVAISQRC